MFHFAYYIVHQETNRVSYVYGLTEYLLPSMPRCSKPNEAIPGFKPSILENFDFSSVTFH